VGPHGALLYRGGLVRFRWDAEAAVRSLRVPVAVAHGGRDAVVPVDMGRRVHRAAAVPGPLLIVAAAGHNDVAWHAGEEYWRWIGAALATGDAAEPGS
jgi:pimeloyl-ACP methyl ester carboxylesterase